ncbi:PaaI family thioesterase [Pseudoalteromonas sp. T1lg65]|uniref:PaaI family thioesterase n=1 Tax=Pseudoalteromonas sp. T1lg65 TaxID=2077101 RepID=UPI003F7910D3
MTGLNIVNSIINDETKKPPMIDFFPTHKGSATPGEVSVNVTPTENHLNTNGTVHGGYAATMLDSVTALAIQTLQGPNATVGTVNLTLNYIRAIMPNTSLKAIGRVSAMTKTHGFAEGELIDDEGEVLATASACCVLIRGS